MEKQNMEKRLKRMNEEQNKTINKMLEVLGVSPSSKYIQELLGKKKFDDEKTKQTEAQLLALEEMIHNKNDNQNSNRIKELEKILEEKTNKVDVTKKRIAQYLEQAQEYERKLDENDREKEELLKGFQAPGTPINERNTSDTLQLSDLERSSIVQTDPHALLASKQAQIDDLKFKIKNLKTKISSLEGDIEILKPNLE